MAHLMPKNPDEVLVTLSDKSISPSKLGYRKIAMSKSSNVRQVGRASSRYNADLSESGVNGWFDNAVMSRNHAELLWDESTQAVSVWDTDSLHGTTVNGRHLEPWVKHRVLAGDTLGFGAKVDKDSKVWYPTELQVRAIELGPPQLPTRTERTNTFTVPDDSEIEEISDDGPEVGDEEENIYSDSDDGGVGHSAMLVQQSIMTPAKPAEKTSSSVHIDLTDDAPESILSDDSNDLHFESTHPDITLPAAEAPAVEAESTPNTTFAPALRFPGKQPVSPQTPRPESLDLPLPVWPSGVEAVKDHSQVVDDRNSHMPLSSQSVSESRRNIRSALIAAAAAEDRTNTLSQLSAVHDAISGASSVEERRLGELESQRSDCLGLQRSLSTCSGQKRKWSTVQDSAENDARQECDLAEASMPQVSDVRARLLKYNKFGIDTERLEHNPRLGEVLERESTVPSPGTVSMAQVMNKDPTAPRDITAHATSNIAKRAVVPPQSQNTTPREKSLVSGGSGSEPARKKMRRLAEAVGYATLGGIAVMSALIATAPEL